MLKRLLPDWIDGFMSLTENSEPPVAYRKWTAISVIASALMRKVKLELGISITVYPSLYIILVGPPSTGKGTIMRYALDIMKEIPVIKTASNATSLQALIRRMKETNLTDIDPRTGSQVYHSSMTVFSEEFTVFLGYNNRELIAALCDWYDCGELWIYDTIKRDREEIRGVYVNILAGTTPNAIQTAFPTDAIGDGLTSRIIFVNESDKDKLVIFPAPTREELDTQQKLISDLEQITLLTGLMKWSENAIDTYADWCIDADRNPPFQDKKFQGYVGRRRNHLLSLAIICSASRGNDLILEKRDIERAAKLLSEVEAKMGTVFKGMGSSDISVIINDAISFIVNSKVDEIPIWQFARRFEGDADKWVLDRVLRTLETMNYIQVVVVAGGNSYIKRLIDNKETI